MGGCVRDFFLSQTPKDIDIEVFGLESKKLQALLSKKYELIKVGKAFGVFKVRGYGIDISLPRLESKMGEGHKGFEIVSDPFLSYKDAASRRDLTINAILWDPLKDEIVDPFGGKEDIDRKVLRHTSKKFVEDPLRVLRCMQFAARFQMEVAPETIALCKTITPENLSKERIFEEWKKMIVKGEKPSLGLKFLKESGWIRYFSELEALIGCPQDPEWHPEGDVWEHTLHCMDAFAKGRIGVEEEDAIVGFGVLCHDYGKPLTTLEDKGRLRSPGHEDAGEKPTRAFLARMTAHKSFIEDVVILVKHHLKPVALYKTRENVSDSAIRRLALKVRRLDRLIRLARADMGGRPPKTSEFPEGDWLLERAHALSIKDSVPKPIIQGRHLIALGQKPGRDFKKNLKKCFEAQLEGRFHTVEEGINFLRSMIG